MFEDTQLPVHCSKCGHDFTERAGRLKSKSQIPCPKCGAAIHYKGGKEIGRSIEHFRQLFTSRVRQIRIKLKL